MVPPLVIAAELTHAMIHERPPDNDRYVRHAPDNPKKVSLTIRPTHRLILTRPLSDSIPLRRYVLQFLTRYCLARGSLEQMIRTFLVHPMLVLTGVCSV
jgi:hypothetical protein